MPINVFDKLPQSFFNCLASGSSNRVYSDCLLTIYHQYDSEISYPDAMNIMDSLAKED